VIDREREIAALWDAYYAANPKEPNPQDYRHTRPERDGGGRGRVKKGSMGRPGAPVQSVDPISVRRRKDHS